MDWHISRFNPAFTEGVQWWSGRLDLPKRVWDSAYVARTDKAYNVYPPLLSMIGFVSTAPRAWREDVARIPPVVPLVVFGLPLPVVGYWVFRQRTRSAFWAAVLTLGWLGGTAVLPCLLNGRLGRVWAMTHLTSQVGLLILAAEVLGRRRVWVALLGLLIACWSRQLTCVFAVAVLYAAWVGGRSAEGGGRPRRTRARRLAVAAAGLAVIAGVPMWLNWAKFGHPLDSGYALIYVGRDHELARDARAHGLFSTAFVGRDAYTMNLAVPWVPAEEGGWPQWKPSEYGTSMWYTTPLLALVWLGVGTWRRDAAAGVLMLCTLPIVAALLCYHGTGLTQPGYYRFALDFIPVWLVVGAGWMTARWRRWATVGCVAWSVVHFAVVGRMMAGAAGAS